MAGWLPLGKPQAALLNELFPGSTVLLSLSKESLSYAGQCVEISRSAGTSPLSLGFSGNNLDMASLATYLGGGTAFIDTWHDQSGFGNDATETTLNKRYQLIIDADGKPSAKAPVETNAISGMVIADNASHKTTIIDAYVVGKIGRGNFDSTNFRRCILGWMSTTATNWESQARWAFGVSDDQGIELPRNATLATRASASVPSVVPISGGRALEFQCWHYNSERLALRANDGLFWDDVTAGGSSIANVTYSGTGALYIGMQGNGAANANATFRTIAIFGTTRADHASIAAYLDSRWSVDPVYPTTWDSGDGFLWTPIYTTNYNTDASDDANGLRYWYENPGYRDNGTRGPSQAIASNVNNGKTLYRTAVGPFDSDNLATGAERSERGIRLGASGAIAKGDTAERFGQTYLEPGPSQTGSWALGWQIHYNSGASPDMVFVSFKGDVFEVFTQRNGVDTSRSAQIPFTRGTWWAWRFRLVWSPGGAADELEIWAGLNSAASLTKISSVLGAAIFSTDTAGAFPKQGVYRGDPTYLGSAFANSGVLAVRWGNEMFSKTSGAFSGLIGNQTSRPDLPTHA